MCSSIACDDPGIRNIMAPQQEVQPSTQHTAWTSLNRGPTRASWRLANRTIVILGFALLRSCFVLASDYF